jgi:2-methylcitrate dehydratase PrpD
LRFLEGKAGLFQLYERGDVNPDVITSEFGKRWDLRALSMKPYPCCRCTHSLIQIGIDLHQEGVALEDIREGELLLGKLNHDYVGGPFNPRDTNPVVHAQFNACYAFSQALSKGKVDCETFTKERILSSDAQSAHKFRSGVSPDIDAGAMSPASVRLVLKDGQVKSVFKKTMKGSPEDPLSEAEVLAKFASNLRWGLNIDAGRAARLGERILELPRTKNVTELMRAFARECVRA